MSGQRAVAWIAWLCCAVSLPAPWTAAPHAEPASATATASPADYAGMAVCRACHPVEASHWERTVHARAFAAESADAKTATAARNCEACHGPGRAHATNPEQPGSIMAFTRDSLGSAAVPLAVEQRNAMCLACHAGGERVHWAGSVHEVQGVACADCHNPMARHSERGLLARAGSSATCFQCHTQQRSEFRKRSHMPLLEGAISCNDCHAPHGAPTDALLRAEDTPTLCVRCHADKRGPFLWEHAPATEDCLNCHHPHGSNHERLLREAVPYLCQSCHPQAGSGAHATQPMGSFQFPSGPQPDSRALNRGCVNCHVQIHGSNHPSGVRFHR